MKEKDSKGTQFKPLVLPDAGLQPARCYAIIDLGSHLSFFKNQPVMNSKTGKQVITDKIVMYFELPKFMNHPEDPQYKPFPSTVKCDYTYSADAKAKLPDVLKSWGPMKARPEKLTNDLLKKFVGHPCMLTIEHDEVPDKKNPGKKVTYANVSGAGRGVNPWMKEMTLPVKCNEPIFFALEDFTWDAFKKLPKYAQGMIRKSLDFPKIVAKMPEPVAADAAVTADSIEDAVEIFEGDLDTPDDF